jgi:hypothetical protein
MQLRALAIVPPAPLTRPGTALTYVRGALVSPVCISLAVFASCIGVGFAGVLGALGAFIGVALVISSSTRYRFVRRHLDREAHTRMRCTRETRRIRMLRPAGPVRVQQYLELRALVEETERLDGSEAARFELQDLLEHFSTLASTHQRCLDALRLAGSHDLPAALPIDPHRSKRRREIQIRRLRHREACLTRIERLAEELEAVDELIRLFAQRIALPLEELDMDREVDRRLGELDELEAAIKQLDDDHPRSHSFLSSSQLSA